MLVHRYDGNDVSVRVNGQTVASDTVDVDPSVNRDLQFGRWERTDNDPHWYFDGKIAEPLIFDQGLEDEEIENVEEYLAKQFDLERTHHPRRIEEAIARGQAP